MLIVLLVTLYRLTRKKEKKVEEEDVEPLKKFFDSLEKGEWK